MVGSIIRKTLVVAVIGISGLGLAGELSGCSRGCEPAKAYISSLENLARDAEVALYAAQSIIVKMPESEDRDRGLKALETAAKALEGVRKTLNAAMVACTSPSPSSLFEAFNGAWSVIRLILPLIADDSVGGTRVPDPEAYAFRRR